MLLINKNLLLFLGVLVALFLPPLVGVISGAALLSNREAHSIAWAIIAIAILVWVYNFLGVSPF